MSYTDATDIARDIRAAIKQAQKAGHLDRDVKVSVRVGRASMCTEINVRIQGDKLTNEWLLRPDEQRAEHGCWTEQATELAGKVRALMGPAEEWHDGKMRFSCLYFRGGLCAP